MAVLRPLPPLPQPDPSRPHCDTCRFAEPTLNNDGVQYVRHDGISLWECHRHAPVVVMSRNGGARQEWPAVMSVHWCGDHEPIAKVEG